MISLGQGIRVARLQAKWSQKRLAKVLGVDASYLSMIEANKRVPSLEVLARIADECRLKLSQLVLLCETMDGTKS
jgi:transcriptional regulator with XRE-family HTH domain